MNLLLTLNYETANNILLQYDTNKKKGKYISLNEMPFKKIKRTSGIVYSGKYLCIGVQSCNDYNDYFVIYNIYNFEYKIFKCKFASNIKNIVSIYPGKLYASSYNNDSIISIEFDDINLQYFKDSIYYTLEKNCGLNSFFNYNNKWFCIFKNKGMIFDLSNDRVIYTNISKPRNLFFNNNQRLCFIESDKSLLHIGNDIFKLKYKDLRCVIEDLNLGGYWASCNNVLCFIDYDGYLKKTIYFKKGMCYNNIVNSIGAFDESN